MTIGIEECGEIRWSTKNIHFQKIKNENFHNINKQIHTKIQEAY